MPKSGVARAVLIAVGSSSEIELGGEMQIIKWAVVALALSFGAQPVIGAPKPYQLVASKSKITFEYSLDGTVSRGAFTQFSGNFLVDVADFSRTKADVSIETKAIKAAVPFVKSALKDKSMLSVLKFPRAKFETLKIVAKGETAVISGLLTLRGQSKPLLLKGQLFRPAGSAADDFSNLIIKMSGRFNRHDFGVSGYPKLVGSKIGLNITAYLTAQ